MLETGVVRFPGNLDPRAQEFRPRHHLTLLHPHIYHPCPSLPDVRVIPFSDDAALSYTHFPFPPAHVSPAAPNPPLPPRLPPPSATPSRTLLLSSVPTDVSESTVRMELEVFGDVRAVQMERVRDGIVTVHFYDLGEAQAAMVEIRGQHMQQQLRMRKHFEALLMYNWSFYEAHSLVGPLPPPARGLIAGRAVWAQYMVPAIAAIPGGHNQGTIVVFNLDPEVSSACLKEIFEVFGHVKEVRWTPLKRHQKFVEFYDIRDASKALAEMNGKEINGKNVFIEFSRAGGYSKSKRIPKATNYTINNFNSSSNYSLNDSQPLPPRPPPPPPQPRLLLHAPKKWDGGRNVQASMSALCISDGEVGNGSKDCEVKYSKKSQSTKTKNSSSGGSSSSSRGWKGRAAKNSDPRFSINEDAIVESNCGDTRTTVMIKNIPNKYSQKLLMNMLDSHCIHCNEQIGSGEPLSAYDFVYLPIDFMNKCNVGYGFVNMTSPQATLRLYKAFHLQNWEVFNSRKICQVTYARLQGLEALKDHFKNSKFPWEAEDYMPVMFSPPRDGRRHLTEPTPILGRPYSPHHLSSATSSKDSEYNNHEDEMDGGDRLQQPPLQENDDEDIGNDDHEDNM